MDNMKRRAFCESLFVGTAVVLVPGCGGGGGDEMASPGPVNPPSPASSCTESIAGNHGHALTVPVADLDSPLARVYDIQGAALHNHTVTLSVEQLRALKAGNAVTVNSSSTELHSHEVTVTCT